MFRAGSIVVLAAWGQAPDLAVRVEEVSLSQTPTAVKNHASSSFPYHLSQTELFIKYVNNK